MTWPASHCCLLCVQEWALWNGLSDCYEQGLVKAVGVSNYGAKELRRVARDFGKRGVPLASAQVRSAGECVAGCRLHPAIQPVTFSLPFSLWHSTSCLLLLCCQHTCDMKPRHLIGACSVGVNQKGVVMFLLLVPLALLHMPLQVQYSLLSSGPAQSSTKAAADDLGIVLIAYSPLTLGLLTGMCCRTSGSDCGLSLCDQLLRVEYSWCSTAPAHHRQQQSAGAFDMSQA